MPVFVCESILMLKKITFLQEKEHHTKWVLPFSCNFIKNARQYPSVLFAHCRGDILLKVVVLYVMHMVILFVKLERPKETGKRRKLRQPITRRSNTVSELLKA